MQYLMNRYKIIDLNQEIYLVEKLGSSVIPSDIFYILSFYLIATLMPIIIFTKIKSIKQKL